MIVEEKTLSRNSKLLSAVSIIPKAYLCGFIPTIIPHLYAAATPPYTHVKQLPDYWSDVLLSGVWSIAGFICFPYALYRVFAFLPEQAELYGAAHCFQSGAMYTIALLNELKVVNPLLAGAIYFLLVGTVLLRDARTGRPWTRVTQSWRLFIVATVIAICAIYAKDSLTETVGWRNFYCG